MPTGCFDSLRDLFCLGSKDGPCRQEQYSPPVVNDCAESWSADKQELFIKINEVIDEGGDAADSALTRQCRRSDGLLSPAVHELQTLIESDPLLIHLFTRMFQEVPRIPPFDVDPTGHPQIHTPLSLLRALDNIVVQAPEFNTTVMAGFPINALLAWPMATPSGIATFLNEKVNAQIRRILNDWAMFLSSPGSTYVLNDNPERGWLGSKALALMPDFAADYVCNPAEPHYGFKSWDAFFTRELRRGARPVERPDDDSVIANACESIPYRLACGVKAQDEFWMKDQAYSLADMLDDPLSTRFVGGTVYQAYLNCTNYHRWHSPVSGVVIKAYHRAGAYYGQSPAVGFDRSAPNQSQAYLTHVATRAVILIEADDPDIGLMVFLPVGITECSSCVLTVTEGQRVEKGEEIGMFRYGGSTYCLIFRAESKLQFRREVMEIGPATPVLKVNSALAAVRKSAKVAGQ